MSYAVSIKHAGKVYELTLDPSQPPAAFKQSIYEACGVPPDRQKVMVKGGTLKDDTDWSKIGLKQGSQFMVIGAAGDLPKPPSNPIVFLEDMDDAALATALRMPIGLVNLGNTCYMNATVQALRAIPELQPALNSFTSAPGPAGGLTAEMRKLYEGMNKTTEKFMPAIFLERLRQFAPQFAEFRPGQGYAQQDAEECLGAIFQSLRESHVIVPATGGNIPFEKYVMGEMTKELKCDEAPEEEPTISHEPFLKIECNIVQGTNYMESSIKENLDQKIEKDSPSLSRSAVYSQKSRISRLPSTLLVHMARFIWRRDINKKAKIMRRVVFPYELDLLNWLTDDLKAKLLPINVRLKEIEKGRTERRNIRKRTKSAVSSGAPAPTGSAPIPSPMIAAGGSVSDVTMSDGADTGPVVASESTNVVVYPETMEDEASIRQREATELFDLLPDDLRADVGSNYTGLYELVGIVGHRGSSADGGHYIGYVRRDVFEEVDKRNYDDPATDQWVKFDDDKVSILTVDKIEGLQGGGEDTAAYILLYRSKRFD